MISKINEFYRGWSGFTLIVIIFGLAAIYTAVHAQFPLPFDETYHFTLINFYTHQWSPFITTQPSELATVGDATRLGSYLSHYVLSFPLRLMQALSFDSHIQIIILRSINVGFVVGALVLFRLFVSRLMNSGLMSNLVVGLYCLIPVSSQLASHINYDNALLLCTATLCVLAQRILMRVTNKEGVSLSSVMVFISVGLIGCLVKFTFLPIALVAFVGVIGAVIYRNALVSGYRFKEAEINYKIVGVILLCLVSTGLFAERYGGNIVQYHNVQPDCSAVQSIKTCENYGPWARNHHLQQVAKTDSGFKSGTILGYVGHIWSKIMVRGLFGVDNVGNVHAISQLGYITVQSFIVMLGGGAVALLWRRRDALTLVLLTSVFLYVGVLVQRNYSEFMQYHAAVAIQGRYILPFVIPILALGLIGMNMYVTDLIRLFNTTREKIEVLKQLETREIFQRSANYWSAKVWRQSTEP